MLLTPALIVQLNFGWLTGGPIDRLLSGANLLVCVRREAGGLGLSGVVGSGLDVRGDG
jgi:hypothetical protein